MRKLWYAYDKDKKKHSISPGTLRKGRNTLLVPRFMVIQPLFPLTYKNYNLMNTTKKQETLLLTEIFLVGLYLFGIIMLSCLIQIC